MCIGVLQQESFGDSVGQDAKDNMYVNAEILSITKIPEQDEGLYLYIPVITAGDLNEFLLKNEIYPY